jgi:hypothetical protein
MQYSSLMTINDHGYGLRPRDRPSLRTRSAVCTVCTGVRGEPLLREDLYGLGYSLGLVGI